MKEIDASVVKWIGRKKNKLSITTVITIKKPVG